MTVRSIDMQVLLPKIAEANRGQPIQNQQSQTEQQKFAAQFQKKIEIGKHQVQNSSKPEGGTIDRDSQGKSGSGGQEEHARDAGREEEPRIDAKDPRKGKIFDIKI